MRTLKMSVVIVLCFILCWTPYYLLGLWYWFFPDDLEGKVSHSLTHILFIFGLFNTCVDPVIYGLFATRFRRGSDRRAPATSGRAGGPRFRGSLNRLADAAGRPTGRAEEKKNECGQVEGGSREASRASDHT